MLAALVLSLASSPVAATQGTDPLDAAVMHALALTALRLRAAVSAEKATSSSRPQLAQCTRAKLLARMPQSR